MVKKNPDGSVPFSNVLYKSENIRKLQRILNTQTQYLSITDEDERREKLDSISDEIFKFYKDIIIGTSLESIVITQTNNKFKEMSRNRNRQRMLDYDGLGGNRRKQEELNDIDETIYNSLKSSEFGKEDNIVRCELNRQEEYPEVQTQKLALWSNTVAHNIEENSLKYATDLGVNIPITNKKEISERDKEKAEESKKRFLSRLRKSFYDYTEDDKYKFEIASTYNKLKEPNFDVSSSTDQNVINLRNLMEKNGFVNQNADKVAMRSFILCIRDQRIKEQFFKLKENFTKDVLLQIKELDGDSVLDAYYVNDYYVKDNKNRDTMRIVIGNGAEFANTIAYNDCVYMNRGWKESLKFEKADEILRRTNGDNDRSKAYTALEEITDEVVAKGARMTKTERDAMALLSSSSTFHLPREEMNNFALKNGIELREGKTLSEKSLAFSGNSAVDVGFGSKSNSIAYEQLPRYRVLKNEAKFVIDRNTKLEKKNASKKGRGE